MLKTSAVPTMNDVVTAHNVRKGKQLVRKIALVSAVTAVVTGTMIAIANRLENEETTN